MLGLNEVSLDFNDELIHLSFHYTPIAAPDKYITQRLGGGFSVK